MYKKSNPDISLIESGADWSINDSIKSDCNILGSTQNLFLEEFDLIDNIYKNENTPSNNNSPRLITSNNNFKLKSGLFKVDKPDYEIIKEGEELDKQKDDEESSKSKKKRKMNIDDSQSTCSQTQNKKSLLNKKEKEIKMIQMILLIRMSIINMFMIM